MRGAGLCLRSRRNQRCRDYCIRAQSVGAYRPGDVLDVLLSQILERIPQLIADLIPHYARDTDAPRLCQSLQSRGDIDAVTVDIVAVGDHIAEIDADAKGDALVLGR